MTAYGLAHLRPPAVLPAYREILRLRADHIPGDLVLVEGCGPDHDSAAMAAALRAAV
jgi:hypothetical protein